MFINVKYKIVLKIKIAPVVIMKRVSVVDLFNKILDVSPPIFLQFSANFGQILGWRPPFRLTPLGNPGFAAGFTNIFGLTP